MRRLYVLSAEDEMPYEVVTLSERPDLADQIDRLGEEAWPRFLLHADTPNWRRAILETFTGFQILVCDSETPLV